MIDGRSVQNSFTLPAITMKFTGYQTKKKPIEIIKQELYSWVPNYMPSTNNSHFK